MIKKYYKNLLLKLCNLAGINDNIKYHKIVTSYAKPIEYRADSVLNNNDIHYLKLSHDKTKIISDIKNGMINKILNNIINDNVASFETYEDPINNTTKISCVLYVIKK